MKRVEEDSKDDNNLVKLEGVEGLWYEQPDILTVIEPENQTSWNRGVSDLTENQVKDCY